MPSARQGRDISNHAGVPCTGLYGFVQRVEIVCAVKRYKTETQLVGLVPGASVSYSASAPLTLDQVGAESLHERRG